MDLKGKVAVVTGATGGLGWDICQALAKEGVKLCMVYGRSQEKAEAQRDELIALGCKAMAVQAEVGGQDGISSMLDAASDRFGGIDILVLDAAYNETIPFPDLETLDHQKWSRIIDFNLTAPFLTARSVVPYLRKRGGGRIITVSSVGGNLPASSSIAYSVSKAGLQHLSRCLAVALAPDILVNDVAPGLMEGTRMTEKLTEEHFNRSKDSSALKRPADRKDVAAAVVMFAKTDSITGQSLVVDSGRCFK